MQKTAKWDVFEIELHGPCGGNPFLDVELAAEARHGNRVQQIRGFYDGDGVYKLRIMPDSEGEWSYRVSSSSPELDGAEGTFLCTPARAGVHGPVRVDSVAEVHGNGHGVTHSTRFAYADGTDYQPVGTTCYCWTSQPRELEELTLKTLAQAPFNKLRMCVFPKHYDFNHNDPPLYAFEGSKEAGWDYTRFQPAFFRHLEQRIQEIGELGIECDLILFHPYDCWGFSKMPPEADRRYLSYLVARLSAYRNVWWSFANEYDLMPEKSLKDWDDFFQLVMEQDPVQHLRSIHNCRGFYDHSKPWVTHLSVQSSDLMKMADWIEQYGKPVVVDECCYEGDIPHDWGNITAEEMVNRMWIGFSLGGYVGHGETYHDPQDVLWWAKGGVLHGESPKRIAFLREVFEAVPGKPLPFRSGFGMPEGLHVGEDFYLMYYNIRQPITKRLRLPEDKQYRAEIIDAWNCTVTPVEGIWSGACEIAMPGKPYQALRLTRI